MSAWWTGSAVPFDLESDGRDPEDARIIQWFVGHVQPTAVMGWSEIVKPERPIPDEAIAVHGISTERATAEGEERAVSIAALARRLAEVTSGGVPVIAHNAPYDATLLDREMRRLGIGSLGVNGGRVVVRIDGQQVGAFHVIDTLTLDKHVDPFRKGKRQLPVVAEHYGVPIRGDAHTADADALAAGRVAWAIAKRCALPFNDLRKLYADRRYPAEMAGNFRALGELSLAELHERQVEWAAEQAAGLAEWARNNPGKTDIDPDTVSGAWPLRWWKE